MNRKILTFGHPILGMKCEDVTNWDSECTKDVLDMSDMLDGDPNAVAIAANQIGVAKNFFVYRDPFDPESDSIVVINPRLIWKSDEKNKLAEGCLSLPGVTVPVNRYNEIIVEYRTLPEPDILVAQKFIGFIARIFQHEMDHLSGLLITSAEVMDQ